MFRFAISSQEDIDISNLRIALLNYIKSQQNSDLFIVRVNDINKESIEGEEQESIDILKKFAINCENLIYQSKNLSIYQQMAKKLVDEKKAYACFCIEEGDDFKKVQCQCKNLSEDEVKERVSNREKFTICIDAPVEPITLRDTIEGVVTVAKEDVGKFTLLNDDATPTPLFANSVDDMGNNIVNIIKESSVVESARESYIQKELGFSDTIEYTHLPSIVEDESENISIKELLQMGFLPDAIINYLISLSVKPKEELFFLPDAVVWLELNSDNIVNRKFNIKELRELNQKHLEKMESKKLSSIFGFADADIGELLKLYLDRAQTINELEPIFRSIFSKKECDDCENMRMLSKIIVEAPYFKEYADFMRYMEKNTGLESEELTKLLLKLLTGMDSGPSLTQIYPYLKSYILEVAQCR